MNAPGEISTTREASGKSEKKRRRWLENQAKEHTYGRMKRKREREEVK
jgi:hypothetical protein